MAHKTPTESVSTHELGIGPREMPNGIFSKVLSSPNRLGLIAAIILQLGVIASLIVALRINIFVDSWADGNSSIHLIYVTFLTILATLITTIALGEARKAWFQLCVGRLSRPRNSVALPPSTSSRILTLTGLGGLSDQLRGWPVAGAFLVLGLVTTAIVAGLGPISVVSATDADYANVYPYLDGSCWAKSESNPSIAGQWFGWQFPNGSSISMAQNSSFYSISCGPPLAKTILLSSVAGSRPKRTSYLLHGVEIAQNASGVPYSATRGFDDTFGTSVSPNFLWATRCMPVLLRNPVRCHAGAPTIQSETTGQMRVIGDNCSVVSKYLQVRPGIDHAAVAGACTEGLPMGAATIVIGGINGEWDSDSGYANFLADMMNDRKYRPAGSTYGVTCDVDLSEAVGFRSLNFSRSDDLGNRSQGIYGITTDNSYGYRIETIDSDNSCTMLDWYNNDVPLDAILSDGALGTGAGASWPLLAENMHTDGWFDSLYYAALNLASHNTSDEGFAFPDSQTALEDALGLMSAITLSLYWGGEGASSTDPLELAAGRHAYSRMRLGPGNLLGLIYVLPSAFAIGVLTFLLVGLCATERLK